MLGRGAAIISCKLVRYSQRDSCPSPSHGHIARGLAEFSQCLRYLLGTVLMAQL